MYSEFKNNSKIQRKLLGNVVKMGIINNLGTWLRYLNTKLTLYDCSFRAVKLTKNADSDKYRYSSYDIGFDAHL